MKALKATLIVYGLFLFAFLVGYLFIWFVELSAPSLNVFEREELSRAMFFFITFICCPMKVYEMVIEK